MCFLLGRWDSKSLTWAANWFTIRGIQGLRMVENVGVNGLLHFGYKVVKVW